MEKINFQLIENLLREVISNVDLSDQDIQDVECYISHGEYGLALEDVVFLLIADNKYVDDRLYSRLTQLVKWMSMEDDIDLNNLRTRLNA